MSKKLKRQMVRILVCLVLFVVALFLPLEGVPRLAVFLALYAAIGWDVLYAAVRNILRGQVFDENFLMAVATVGAMVLGDYLEAVAVLLFYQVGEWFQSYAVGRSRRSIASLMDIRPDYANLVQPNGEVVRVDPEEVQVGQMISVKPGEKIPLDGVVREGCSALDASALTGESVPVDAGEGQAVNSGCINLTGLLQIEVTKPFGESTVSKILELVENATGRKAKTENFITRFARVYTPAVCLAALLLAVLPPLFTGQPFGPWVYRALTFLVISCPCALVISVPLSFFGGIGGASKRGVLVKGGNYLESLAEAKTVVFDKTGTMTEGSFSVSRVSPVGMGEAELLALAALAEHNSNHPIAQSICRAFEGQANVSSIEDAKEIPGQGVQAVIGGRQVLAGNAAMMRANGITPDEAPDTGTVVHLAQDGVYAGYILVEDSLRPDAKAAVARLHALGVERTVMLTGDRPAVAEKVAATLGIDEVHAGLLPADKVARVEELLAEPGKKGTLAFVGDGVNDAPVLARADVGIAMGGLGSDAAIEAADIVIMTDEPSRIADAIEISRKTLAIVRQNIVFALGVKVLVLVLGALGFATMWAAVFADVGVAFLAILNAMRAMYVAPGKKEKVPKLETRIIT